MNDMISTHSIGPDSLHLRCVTYVATDCDRDNQTTGMSEHVKQLECQRIEYENEVIKLTEKQMSKAMKIHCLELKTKSQMHNRR